MMMGFELWFVALAMAAVLFVAWPLLSKRSARHKQIESLGDEFTGRVAFNDALFAEQLQDLDDQLRREEISQAQYEKLKSELEQQNQQDTALTQNVVGRFQQPSRGGAVVLLSIALLLPLIGYLSYLQLGAADDVKIQRLNDQLVRLQQQGRTEAVDEVNRELFETLEARLEKRPDNLNNRFLMARTAVELRDFSRALESYGYILERQPNSPAVLGEMAQVLFIAAGNRFTPEVQQLFDRALMLDPQNGELLGFAGLGAYQSGQFDVAINYWRRGQALLSSEDPRHESWEGAIAEAQRQLGQMPEQQQTPKGEAISSNGISLQVAVSLPAELKLPPETAVFVYARAWEGAKAPLAMQRLRVAELPAVVTLDESMSMVAGMTMSRFPQLEIVARVSLSGSAAPQKGDWLASLGPIDPSASSDTLKLVIDTEIP